MRNGISASNHLDRDADHSRSGIDRISLESAHRREAPMSGRQQARFAVVITWESVEEWTVYVSDP